VGEYRPIMTNFFGYDMGGGGVPAYYDMLKNGVCHNDMHEDDQILAAFGAKPEELEPKNTQERLLKATLNSPTCIPHHFGEFCAAGENLFG